MSDEEIQELTNRPKIIKRRILQNLSVLTTIWMAHLGV